MSMKCLVLIFFHRSYGTKLNPTLYSTSCWTSTSTSSNVSTRVLSKKNCLMRIEDCAMWNHSHLIWDWSEKLAMSKIKYSTLKLVFLSIKVSAKCTMIFLFNQILTGLLILWFFVWNLMLPQPQNQWESPASPDKLLVQHIFLHDAVGQLFSISDWSIFFFFFDKCMETSFRTGASLGVGNLCGRSSALSD